MSFFELIAAVLIIMIITALIVIFLVNRQK